MLDLPLGAFSLCNLATTCPPVVVNLAHLNYVVEDAFVTFVENGTVELVLEEPEPYGTAGTVKALEERLGPRVVTCNTEPLTDLDVPALLDAHERAGTPATVAVSAVPRGADFELAGNVAARFVDRRRDADRPGARFIGVMVMEREVVARIPETRPIGLAETVLRPLTERGELAVHVHGGYAEDVRDLSTYLAVSQDLLAGRGPGPPSAWPGKIVDTDGGRAYVGPDVTAPETSIGPGAILLAGCHIEPRARIEHAIVWPNEAVPAGTVISNSIWALGRCVTPFP